MKAINPYLTFDGNAREAMTFYADALDAELSLQTFRETGNDAPGVGDRVMHAEFRLGESTIFASDVQSGEWPSTGFAISLQTVDNLEAERLFAALAANGRIDVPLMPTPFASRFGMLSDRYGKPWMITTLQQADS